LCRFYSAVSFLLPDSSCLSSDPPLFRSELLAKLDAVQVEVCRRLASDARLLAMGISEANAEGGRAQGEVDQGALLEVEEGLRRLLAAAPQHEVDPPDAFVTTARTDLTTLSIAASDELARYCHRELGRWMRFGLLWT
jgi:hypothetical protein